MSDPIVVNFFDINNEPLEGLTPSFATSGSYKGYWKRATDGVAATPPSVTDDGDGDYTFEPSADDFNTGIRYRLDGGPSAYPRYAYGVIESNASAAPQTTVDPGDLNLFGVTAALLYTRHFPQLSAPTTDSNPSLATVEEIIEEQAAALSGYLLAEDIDALSLTVSNSAAYLWCRETLRLMAAVQVAACMTQQQVPLLPACEKHLAARLTALDENGNLALGGGVAAPAEEPDGPTHFIDHLGLDTSVNDDSASTIDMPFRKDDQL